MLKQLFRRIHFTGVFERDEKEMASICEKGEENLHGAMDILSSIHLSRYCTRVSEGPPDKSRSRAPRLLVYPNMFSRNLSTCNIFSEEME